MKNKAILFINGTGGHKEQMRRLLNLLETDKDIIKIGLCEKHSCLNELESCIEVSPVRDKHSHLKSLFTIPYHLLFVVFQSVQLLMKYEVLGIVSTGPGVVFIPSLIFKLLGKKVIFIESWSRFKTKSLTGTVMHSFADLFYVQNKSLKSLYKNSIYSGRL